MTFTLAELSEPAKRPSFDKYFLQIALVVATRATCARRRVGSVAADKNNYLLGTGYNGLAKGVPHCIDNPCAGANSKSGSNLDVCQSTHAEQNLIAHVQRPQNIHTVYLTVSPCISCVKLLVATGCKRILFLVKYPNSEKSEDIAKASGVEFSLFDLERDKII